jgi:ketosteroid isomerase-like protein
MSAFENKALMKHICDELSNGNSQPLIESMADEFCWTIIGTTKWSGTYCGKEAVLAELLQPLREQFATQYTNTAHRFIA